MQDLSGSFITDIAKLLTYIKQKTSFSELNQKTTKLARVRF
jgi:hypothetical protein